MQKNALKIAKDAAAEFKDLDLMVCGDVANTNIFDPGDASTHKECQKMYEEQIRWAKEADVDFVDIAPQTWNLSVSALAAKLEKHRITGKTLPKILVPVHFSGQPTDQEQIWELAQEFGFKVLEDASFKKLSEFRGCLSLHLQGGSETKCANFKTLLEEFSWRSTVEKKSEWDKEWCKDPKLPGGPEWDCLVRLGGCGRTALLDATVCSRVHICGRKQGNP